MDDTKIPFNSLPLQVQESLLWDMELEYDSYESSKPETVHNILNGNCDSANRYVIKNYYKALSPESLFVTIVNVREEAKRQVDGCSRAMWFFGSLSGEVTKSLV